MPRRRLNSIDDYSRALKNGRGVGVGTDYLPWLPVGDVSSKGKSAEIPGILIERTHHVLSGLEARLFYYAEFNPYVIDIREQFPLLPLDLAVRVAADAGIKYPITGKSGAPCVLTTDFLLTLKLSTGISYLAVSVKEATELADESVLARLEIERLWWENLGIPHRLATDEQLDEQQAANLAWVSDPLRGTKRQAFGANLEPQLGKLSTHLTPGMFEKPGLVTQLSAALGVDPEYTAKLLRVAIWKRVISVNLDMPLEKGEFIEILEVRDAENMSDQSHATAS